MELNPQAIADAQFRVIRKGYDPEQVRPLLTQAAESLRSALSRASTAEGRVSVGRVEGRATPRPGPSRPRPGPRPRSRPRRSPRRPPARTPSSSAGPCSRRRRPPTPRWPTPSSRPRRIVAGARDEAKKITTDARAAAARMVADAEQAARAAHAAELERTKADITELSSRRDQLRADADFLAAHLERPARAGGRLDRRAARGARLARRCSSRCPCPRRATRTRRPPADAGGREPAEAAAGAVRLARHAPRRSRPPRAADDDGATWPATSPPSATGRAASANDPAP